jgi:DNA-binding NtrC family response regulator
MTRPRADETTTIVQERFDPSAPPTSSYEIVVHEGPSEGAGVVVDDARPGRVLVGSGALCGLRVEDAQVSRRHLALELGTSWLRLEDLGSTNGTLVNGVRVREAFLTGGELVRIGATLLRVDRRATAATAALPAAGAFGRVCGASREMRRLYPLFERLAQTLVPVIIEGETGTGKEVLAESLHERGPRADKPFIVFDCTAVPASLLESELFGHERGAFTGAQSQRKGVFEEAEGGTLFIDEIGDLEIELQPKLLRAIERAEVRRVGGNRWIKCDVRILAATRRDLDAEVEAGRFRDDLFHRLAVARVELPPLRSRRGDIGILVRELTRQVGAPADAIPASVIARWERHPWPGNVRELRNAVVKFLALGETLLPTEVDSEQTLEDVLAAKLPFAAARQRALAVFQRRYIEGVLAEHEGNVSRAAAASGMARRYFQILRARAR